MKDLLKFITCGSVDDGKSTLIGHMLYDAKLLFADHQRALELDSKLGSRAGELDYSLLLDGLMAEREQGITIDVAYRYFTTNERSFIVADCPGHEQYTRNMAVGASFADLAVILVDVQGGVTLQTKRHARICALMGIRHFVLAVNKMDLVDFEFQRFHAVRRAFMAYMADLPSVSVTVIPVSATGGDNVVEQSRRTPWYKGTALLPYLEQIDVLTKRRDRGFVLPVQRVCRPDHTFRGFQGQIEAGQIATGETVTILPSEETACVKSIHVANAEADNAAEGQAVTLQLDREVDVSRGCVITSGEPPLHTADMFRCTVLWMDDAPLVAGRGYLLKCGARTLPATVLSIRHKIDVENGNFLSAQRIFKNELAICDISLSERMVFASFHRLQALGGFILMDRVSNMTSACGVISEPLYRANLTWHKTDITRAVRAGQKNQEPVTLWFTGLSGAGKSVLANALEQRLVAMGRHTMLLDGDNIRHGLCRDLGFDDAGRVENIRRVAEVAALMNEAGLIVLTAFISPFSRDRQQARDIIGGSYREIYVSTPLEECERRDVKGLYKKARAGKIPEFTGITSPYEPPQSPDFTVDTTGLSVEDAVERIINKFFAAQ